MSCEKDKKGRQALSLLLCIQGQAWLGLALESITNVVVPLRAIAQDRLKHVYFVSLSIVQHGNQNMLLDVLHPYNQNKRRMTERKRENLHS